MCVLIKKVFLKNLKFVMFEYWSIELYVGWYLGCKWEYNVLGVLIFSLLMKIKFYCF